MTIPAYPTSSSLSTSRLQREVKRVLGRLRHVSWPALASGLVRAAALHRRAGRTPGHLPPERVIVTLTTIPERADRLNPTLRSLLDQTCLPHEIVLAWPKKSKRRGRDYPALPPLPDRVRVLPCEDWGPATKLLPALRDSPDAILIVVDDDVIYPPDFVENLVRTHRRYPQAALGWRGWQLSQGGPARYFDHVFSTGVAQPTPVDVLLGTWGYLIPPGALDDRAFALNDVDPALAWVDDVWVSGNLARRRVPRLVVPSRMFPLETRNAFISALTDTENQSGDNDAIAIEAFREWW